MLLWLILWLSTLWVIVDATVDRLWHRLSEFDNFICRRDPSQHGESLIKIGFGKDFLESTTSYAGVVTLRNMGKID
jgi:hypothetical protein